MKSLNIGFFYYTGTGATAKFATILGDYCENRGHSVTFHRITSTSEEKFEGYGLVMLGGPVWMWRAPRVITSRMKTYALPKMPFVLFATCGGTPGNAFWSMYKVLKHSGGQYLGYVVGKGTNNIRAWRPQMGKPESPVSALTESSIQESLQKLDAILSTLENRESDITTFLSQVKKPEKYLKFSLLGAVAAYRRQVKLLVGTKTVDAELCTRCGLCATKICPSGAITIGSEGLPEFNERLCEGCQGCVNLCPTLAIGSKMVKGKQPFRTYSSLILI